jgi:hypothetical protein
MSAEHPQHDTPTPDQQAPDQELPSHPFTKALETWDAWSMANTMRSALAKAREQGNQEVLARFEQYPQWTQGPDPISALAANREVVDRMTGWRWQAMRQAREEGRGWHEIAGALGVKDKEARESYLQSVEAQRQLAEELPFLGYQPRWRELADDNDADRAELQRQALAYDDPGCPADWPRDNTGREAGHER